MINGFVSLPIFFTVCTDCAKHDPEVNKEMEKNFVELLSEELKLREAKPPRSNDRLTWHYLRPRRWFLSFRRRKTSVTLAWRLVKRLERKRKLPC